MKWLWGMILGFEMLLAASGAKVFEQKCLPCHTKYIPQSTLLKNFENNNTDLNLTAPTLNQLSFWLKSKIGDRKADAESQAFAIEDFIMQYIENPDKSKGVLPHKFSHFFKTMPSMKGKIGEEEIELVTQFIFDYAEAMISDNGVQTYSYEEALIIAKKEHKMIMIEGYIPYCRYCIKMDREVMVEDVVKEALNKDFIVVKKNLLIETLPLGIKKLRTPSFYFIDSDGKRMIDSVEGFGNMQTFLDLLKMIKDER